MRGERLGGVGGIHDHPVGEAGGGVDPPQMPCRLPRAGIFRMGRGDQVMDQRHEGAAAGPHRLDRAGPLQRPVRDQQEGAARAQAADVRRQLPGAEAQAGEKAEAAGDPFRVPLRLPLHLAPGFPLRIPWVLLPLLAGRPRGWFR